MDSIFAAAHTARSVPLSVVSALVSLLAVGVVISVYLVLYFTAPVPRAPLQSEKTFTFITEDGTKRKHQPLPCWYDKYVAEKEAAQQAGRGGKITPKVEIEVPEVYVSLVIPAYNEEERLGIMLTEAAEYLEKNYGPSSIRTLESQDIGHAPSKSSSKKTKSKKSGATTGAAQTSDAAGALSGYEIIIVSDGSTDRTTEIALNFARKQLPEESRPAIRVVSLERNRGKGGAVTHGLRHVRGSYALFADADGATRFSDLGAVLDAARAIELKNSSGPPGQFPAVSVGSRAHMVNTPAVVKRSALRNLLMRGFHIFLKLMTPPATAHIGDTQCGFKLFSRGSLPAIVPWMHSEGWIFDVEMLMLAESAGIAVAEVPVGWKEVGGSKLNVVWDSLGMAWGLAVLRGSWLLGIYTRKW